MGPAMSAQEDCWLTAANFVPDGQCCLEIFKRDGGPDWVAQLVRTLSQYTKVMGSIPGRDTYKSQPMNVWMGRTTN